VVPSYWFFMVRFQRKFNLSTKKPLWLGNRAGRSLERTNWLPLRGSGSGPCQSANDIKLEAGLA